MKNMINKNSQWLIASVLVLLIPIVFGFTNPAQNEVTCPPPQVSVTSQSAGSAAFSWSPVSGASRYVVFFVREEDSYTSQETYTSNTSISFSGLSSGTYNFYFATVCGNEVSGFIIIEDLLL